METENAIRENLILESEFELGRRLAAGSLGHIVLFGIVLLSTPFLKDHPAAISTAGTALLLTNSFRFWLSRRQSDFYPRDRKKWMRWFDFLLALTAFLWGFICALSIHYYGLTSVATSILLLVTGGICSAAATSLNPSAKRAQGFVAITLAIPFLRIAMLGDPQATAFSAIFVTYGVFLFMQIRGQAGIYWNLLYSKKTTEFQTQVIDESGRQIKSVEQERDRVANELKQIFDAIDRSAIVVITDRNGKILQANDSFCKISGYTRDELKGQDHRIVNSGVHPKEFFRDLWDTISAGKIWVGEIQNRRKDGSFYWVYTVITPLSSETGKPDRYLSIRFDISPRKRMEEELVRIKDVALRAYQRLEEGERIGKFGSWQWDLRQHDFNGSMGFRQLLHLSDTSALTYESFIAAIVEEDRKIFEPAIEESVMTGQPFSCSCRIMFPDGPVRWLHVKGHPIQDESGVFHKLAGSAQDVTEKIQTERLLFEATARAKSANSTKAKFLANMSHEIRTPMNGIIGMTNLLLVGAADQQQVEKLKIIQNCGNSLLELIDDILDFSKLEADKLELENEPFALHECVKEMIALLNTRASEKGLVLSYHPAADVPPWIRGDITRFRQIIANLLSNAIKFTQKGSITVSAKAFPLQDGFYEFQFQVQDTGVGIPDAVKSKLFQSFSQVDAATTRKYGGTGLGLAISKGLCEKMGGTVSVESQVGQGSTFTVSFKAQRCEALQPVSPASPVAAVIPDMGKTNPLRILVAEDNRVNQLVLTGLLGKLGYYADVAENGRQALDSLAAKSYDVVLLDCHMPSMDGFEAAEKIVERYAKENRPKMIAVTASTMKEDIDRCLASGMDSFIGKPIVTSALVKVLSECKRREPMPLPTLAPAACPYDRTAFSGRFQGMEDLAANAISAFLNTLPNMIFSIDAAIASKKPKDLELAAHALKGALSNFYAEPARQLAWQLEQIGCKTGMEGSEEIFFNLKTELSRLQEALTEALATNRAA